MNIDTSTRHAGSVTIVDISGRLVFGEESASLGKLISDLLAKGHRKILLNLADVSRIDTSGLAYLISSLTSVRKQQGELKLLNPTKQVHAVMELTKLLTIFDIKDDEAAAVQSFGDSAAATA